MGLLLAIDKCLPPRNRNRTWLIKYYFVYFRKDSYEGDWREIKGSPGKHRRFN